MIDPFSKQGRLIIVGGMLLLVVIGLLVGGGGRDHAAKNPADFYGAMAALGALGVAFIVGGIIWTRRRR